MLTVSYAPQCLETITGGRGKHTQFNCSMQLKQLAQGYSLNLTKSLGTLVRKQAFRFFRAKTLDH